MKKELKKTGLKLKLHRETLQALEQGQLADIAGGFVSALTNCPVCRTNGPTRCTQLC